VVVAAGAVESPKILMASENEYWPEGIGNTYGHLGKHVTAHPLVRVVGEMDGNPDNLEQPVDFPTLACRSYDSPEWQQQGKFFFVRDGRKNATNIENEFLSGVGLASIQTKMRQTLPFELRGFVEVFSDPENFIKLDSSKALSSVGGYKTSVHFKKTEKTISAITRAESHLSEILKEAGCSNIKMKTYDGIRADHATSTCRMSKGEAEGVVDSNLLVHGTDNIFVCSNAVIPNGAAVNPTLTLIAITEKLADYLA
jgi:choline dehydrogenase-like flavoprotein